MTGDEPVFLLDANVLISAHRSYYAFDICPGFWESIKAGHENGRIFSTQRVKNELERGQDALTDWMSDHLPSGFFINDSSAEIAQEYAPMMAWVVARDFTQAAEAKFATDADGWLVATAKRENYILVTHETRKPEAKTIVPMPNVCEEFSVDYADTFKMLRLLSCQYS